MGMLIPIHSLLVPIYVVFKRCGISNHWFTLLLPYVSFGLPMGIFLVEGFVKTVPVDLEEAAAIDGSSFSHTLWNIIFPICRPILVTVAIIQVFSCWNEFSFALVLIKDVGLQTTDSVQGPVCIGLPEADGSNADHNGTDRCSVLCIQQADHQWYGCRSG